MPGIATASIMSIALTTILASALAGLQVETGSPDALCPDLAQAEKAILDRLGTLRLQSAKPWRARYTIGHAPEAGSDFVRLELFDPEGRVCLQRDLPLAGESCTTISSVIALMLDSYFRSLASTPHPAPEQPPADDRGKAPSSTSTTMPVPTEPPAPPVPPVRKPKPSRLQLGAGMAAVAPPVGPALVLDIDAPLGRHLRLGLLAAASLGERREALGGLAPNAHSSLRSHPFRWSLAFESRHAAVGWHVGPELLLALETAESSGLVGAQSGLRVVPGIGGSAGLSTPIAPKLTLGLTVAVDVALRGWTNAFQAGGVEVLAPPVWYGMIATSIRYSL